MKRDREVRGGRQGCRKSVKTGQEKRVCGWEGGCCVVTLEAARLVACSPLDMRLLTGALNQHEAPTLNEKSSGGAFLLIFCFFCPHHGGPVSPLFSLNSLGTALHMLVLYLLYMWTYAQNISLIAWMLCVLWQERRKLVVDSFFFPN